MKTKLFYTFLFCIGFMMECGGNVSPETNLTAKKNSLFKDNSSAALSDTLKHHKDMRRALINR